MSGSGLFGWGVGELVLLCLMGPRMAGAKARSTAELAEEGVLALRAWRPAVRVMLHPGAVGGGRFLL